MQPELFALNWPFPLRSGEKVGKRKICEFWYKCGGGRVSIEQVRSSWERDIIHSLLILLPS